MAYFLFTNRQYFGRITQTYIRCAIHASEGHETKMQNWDDLKFCLALDRYNTMTAAAKALGTNVATVSRRTERMTEQAGQPLFVRDQTQWVATDLGKRLANLAGHLETGIQSWTPGHCQNLMPQKLRISLPDMLACVVFKRDISPLFDHLPHLELSVSDKSASLAYGETDLVLSYDEPTEGRVLRRKITDLYFGQYQHARLNAPATEWLSIASNHDIEQRHDQRADFGSAAAITVTNVAQAVDIMAMRPISCLLPVTWAHQNPDLVALPAMRPQAHSVWVSYHVTRRHDRVLQQAMTWLDSCLQSKH